ncbi:MAG: 7-cyano-7-deazaguanine synthase [Candidatus Omnitrophica bacterium ADurb.Bin205]|nr:MAG: 7-cyano-7-deazaguanine synthase [Candidatus Omnitrophica bacterium ADurb.Bin205]
MKIKARKAVVLLSGGLDSATVLYLAKNKGYEPVSLIFDYGQRHRKEIEAAKNISRKAEVPYRIEKISLPWGGSSLLGKNNKIPRFGKSLPNKIPSTYVPARNIIFLSFALSLAESLKAEAVFIGAHSLDYSGYPDCRRNFLTAFSRAAALGTASGVNKQGIKIIAPLINKRKSGIIKLGARLKVPYRLTWSCYEGGKLPCGKCDSCYYRAKGFKEAGIKDPAL